VNIVTLACHCDVQQALDKMASEWTPINFEVMSYKSTGTYIIKIGEEVSQLLDDHIVMTQSMSFSPYKQPFEERISKWESQLRITQVCVCVCVFTTSHVSYLVSSFFTTQRVLVRCVLWSVSVCLSGCHKPALY